MSDLQRSGPVTTHRDNEFELNFLHNKLITVPKNVQCGRQQYQNDWNDEESQKKANTVDKRFWKKLRMIKVYQNCRFCNKSRNILNGVHVSIPGSFCASIQQYFNSHHWTLIALQQSLTNCFTIQLQQKNKNKSQNDKLLQTQSNKLTKLNYISELQSVNKMKELVQYYKYYQYIPLTPQSVTISAKSRQPKAFVLVHDFLDKKITIFYRRIKQILADKNSQDSLQASSENQDHQQKQQCSKSDEQMSDKKVVSKGLFDSESNISSQSVRDLLCQIGDSTNVIKSSAKSSFLDGKPKSKNILRNQYFSNVDARIFEQQLLDKKNCQSNKNSLKKSTKKGSKSNKKRLSISKKEKGTKINYKTQPIGKREVESDNEKLNRQDKKLRMSTNISTKKLKKKKMRNSCDNLLTHALPAKKYQIQRSNERKIAVKGSERNLSKGSEAPLFEQKKIRNYIVDLKRKINKDKEKLRENYQDKVPENHSFKLRYKAGETIQLIKSKEDKGIKQKKRKIESDKKEMQDSCQKSDFKTFILDKKGEKEHKSTNERNKNGFHRDMTKKQQNNESPVAAGAQQSKKKKGGKQKMSKKKNIGEKQKIKTTARNRGEQTNTYTIKKEQTEEPKKQVNEKVVRNKKIGRRQKSNIFNTRVHSSITTQLDF